MESESPPAEANGLHYNLRPRQGRSAVRTPQKLAISTKSSQPCNSPSASAHEPLPYSGQHDAVPEQADKNKDLHMSPVEMACKASPARQLDKDCQSSARSSPQTIQLESSASQEARSCRPPDQTKALQSRQSTAASPESLQPQPEHPPDATENPFGSPVHGLLRHSQPVEPLVPYLSPASPALSQEEVFSTPEVTDQDLMARVRDCQPSGPWQKLAASEEQCRQTQQDLESAHATIAAHQKQLSAMLEHGKHDAAKHAAQVSPTRSFLSQLPTWNADGSIQYSQCDP